MLLHLALTTNINHPLLYGPAGWPTLLTLIILSVKYNSVCLLQLCAASAAGLAVAGAQMQER